MGYEAGELFKHILILKPERQEIENKIGKLALEAYDKRDHANKIEYEAIKLL